MLSWLAQKLEVHRFCTHYLQLLIKFKMSTLTAAVAMFCFLQLMVVAAALHSDGDLCPTTDITSGSAMVTSYLSVDGSGMEFCGLQYMVPARATLYQGMLAADQQHDDFEFESTLHSMFGHFITSINNVEPMDDFYWLVYSNATMMLTPVGVDWIHVENGSLYIWQYSNNSDHTQTYNGPCNGPSVIPPTATLNYKVLSLTVSGANVMNDTFKPVCMQPVLIASTSERTTVFGLVEEANRQIPIIVKAGLNAQNKSVTSFNGVANRGGYLWTGYKDGSNESIPYDLSLTTVTDGNRIEFKYENPEKIGSPGGAPSVGQSVALLTLAGLLANVMTSVY